MKNLLLILISFVFVGLLAACQTYTPVIDPGAVNQQNEGKYYKDQAQCQAIAKQSNPQVKETAKDTAIGAGVGAGTGALIGVITGSAGKGALLGTVIGGVAGGAKGVYSTEKGYEQVYRNCMICRGWHVLN